jgi:hypothetical protein
MKSSASMISLALRVAASREAVRPGDPEERTRKAQTDGLDDPARGEASQLGEPAEGTPEAPGQRRSGWRGKPTVGAGAEQAEPDSMRGYRILPPGPSPSR